MNNPPGLEWHKSDRSGNGGDCVEVAENLAATEGVFVRDTKNRDKGQLNFDPKVWTEFIGGIRNGDFDL